MLAALKLALRLTTTVYDSELLGMIASAIADLQHCGPKFIVTPVKDLQNNVIDYTVTDPLVQMAIITYCRMHFGSPADYDRLKASYDEQKGQMRESSAYGMEVLG